MKTRRLLYVDDSEEMGELVKLFFEQRFPAYEVSLATSVEHALEQLYAARESSTLPNAIAVDANLSAHDDGLVLIESVRFEFPKIRTVLVSGMPPNSDEMPAHAFVLKDGNANAFVERIFELIQARTDELPTLSSPRF
jgi:ActR/RegA family two-component response regulator